MKTKESYFEFMGLINRLSTISFAILLFVSCSSNNGKDIADRTNDPTTKYKTYLYEVRKMKNLSVSDLILHINDWQKLKDTVTVLICQDTVKAHSTVQIDCTLLYDSIRMEFSRLAMEIPRTYKEVLIVKERLSPYDSIKELQSSVHKIRPFFNSLDKHATYKESRYGILTIYRSLLKETLNTGIQNIDELKNFIEKEDIVFRSFLPHLSELNDTDITDIARNTDKCYSSFFSKIGCHDITYTDAMVYIAMRTNRRLIQNTRMCLEDIHQGKVKNKQQALAYIYMILQPYASLDHLSTAVLSHREKEELYDMAACIPRAFEILATTMETGDKRLNDLPGMLIDIFISSL